MDHDKENEAPHEHVMEIPHHHEATQERLHRPQNRVYESQKASVIPGTRQNEPRHHHEEEHEKETRVCERLKRSIEMGVGGRFLRNQRVEFYLLPEIAEFRPGEKILPVSMETGEECEIDTLDEYEHENHAEKEVNEADIAHEEFVHRLAMRHGEWSRDVKARGNENEYGCRHDPVIDTEGHRPFLLG